MTLRPYQREAIDAAFQAWADKVRRPVLLLATGSGKTFIFSALTTEFRGTDPASPPHAPVPKWVRAGAVGGRVVVLAHRDELVDQAIKSMRKFLPAGTRIGKVKAGSNAVGADVMVCSVQTLARAKRLDSLLSAQARYGKIGLVISDECHLAGSPHGKAKPSSWMRVLDALPEALHLGVTATLGRGDGKGLGDVWDKVVYLRSTEEMIKAGYLAPLDTLQVGFDVDLSDVRTRGGDYVEADLAAALLAADLRKHVVQAYEEHAGGRPGLVFTPDVATAQEAADGLNAAGIPAAVVSGQTPRGERQAIYRDFAEGRLRMLANCQVLTTGFDAPHASVAILARHTKSKPLFQQMVGRVLRTHETKDQALLLDLTEGAATHDLHPIVDLRRITLRKDKEACGCETVCEGCAKCPSHDECANCAECPLWGGCDQCPVCAQAEDRSACPGCGRCRGTGPGGGATKFAEETRRINLFSFEDGAESSTYVWGRTDAGVHFLSVQGGYVFLWPDEGGLTYTVCFAPGESGWQRTDKTGLDLASAMRAAEKETRERGLETTAKKRAGWRKSAPNVKQVWLATRYGIDATGMTAGQIYERTEQIEAGKIFDHRLPAPASR